MNNEKISPCSEHGCDWCKDDDMVVILLDRRTATELAQFTETYAPLVREVAFACKKALK